MQLPGGRYRVLARCLRKFEQLRYTFPSKQRQRAVPAKERKVNKPYGVKAIDDSAEVYVTGPDGKLFADAGMARICNSADEADLATLANVGNARRIAASLNACHMIATGAIERITEQQEGLHGVLSELEMVKAERDELLAALQQYEAAFESLFSQCCSNPIKNAWGKEVDVSQLNLAHEAARQALKTVTDTSPRYTSVSKGGTYTKLGAIRGAGSLKGLAGIAYQNEKGDLFIREPECFAKRMVLVEQPEQGGAA